MFFKCNTQLQYFASTCVRRTFCFVCSARTFLFAARGFFLFVVCGFILFAACGLFCLHRAAFFARSVRIYFVCSVRTFLFAACKFFRFILFAVRRFIYLLGADLFCSQCADLFSLQCILFCEMCNFLLYGGILPGKMCPLWASVFNSKRMARILQKKNNNNTN